MKQAFPSLSPELKQRLEASGFKPIKTPPLNDWYNPNSSQCNTINFHLFFFHIIVFLNDSFNMIPNTFPLKAIY